MPVAKRKMKRCAQDIIFDIANFLFLSIVLVCVAYPLIYIVSSSFSDPQKVVAGEIWLLPKGFNLTAYYNVFTNKSIFTGYYNSIINTVIGTALNVVFTLIVAYPISRKDFRGGALITFLFTFTMIFNGGLIPTYQVVQATGLMDTRWALIIPTLITPWNLIITKSFFQSSIPFEMYEAAELDGASDLRTFVSIVLPVSKSVIAVIALFYAVTHWNAYFDALIYISSQDLFPLQIALRNILFISTMSADMFADAQEIADLQAMAALLKYALIVVASLPVMIIYPFVQKYFVKGVMIGAVKG